LADVVREQTRNSKQFHRGEMQAIESPAVRLSRDPLLAQGYLIKLGWQIRTVERLDFRKSEQSTAIPIQL
jgi:hypothetical protein